MTGDRLPTYQNAVPESVLDAVAKQVLGARLHAWSKAENGRICVTFEKLHHKLVEAITSITEETNELELDEFDVPESGDPPKPEMSRTAYKRKRQAELETRLHQVIASFDKLTVIHLRLSAGGAGAMLAGLKQMQLPPDVGANGERNVTPRRRYGAGLSAIADTDNG